MIGSVVVIVARLSPSSFLLPYNSVSCNARQDSAMSPPQQEQHSPLGEQRRELIIGGERAPQGRYPYFSTLQHYCGGSLIAPDVILTAGHCLPAHKHAVQPRVGTYSFFDGREDSDHGELFNIKHMVRHDEWKALGEDEFRHDFTLLFLGGSSAKQYVKLNRNPGIPIAGETLTVMGVGWTTADWERAKKSVVLRETELNYLPNDQCRLSNNTSTSSSRDDDNSSADDDNSKEEDEEDFVTYEGRVHSDHICTTGGPNNERDAW